MKKAEHLRHLSEQSKPAYKNIHEKISSSIKNDVLITPEMLEVDVEPDSFGERIADKVATFGGSWKFILTFTGILLTWILINVTVLMNKGFDPYPFILLNLVLSCVAALQAPFIMMSQNRQEVIDRRRAENDYMINLKAEIEIRDLHDKVDELIRLLKKDQP